MTATAAYQAHRGDAKDEPSRQRLTKRREQGQWSFLTWSFFLSQIIAAEQAAAAAARSGQASDETASHQDGPSGDDNVANGLISPDGVDLAMAEDASGGPRSAQGAESLQAEVAMVAPVEFAPQAKLGHGAEDSGPHQATAVLPDMPPDSEGDPAVDLNLTGTPEPAALDPTTGPLGDLPDTVVGPLADVVAPVLGLVGDVVDDVVAPVLGLVGDVVDDVVAPVLGLVGNVVDDVAAPVLGLVGDVVDDVAAPVLGLVGNVVDDVAAPVLGLVGDVVGDVAAPVLGLVGDVVGDVTAPVLGLVGDVVGDVAAPVIDLLGDTIQTLDPVIDSVVAPVVGLAGDLLGDTVQTLDPVIDSVASPVAGLAGDLLGDTVQTLGPLADNLGGPLTSLLGLTSNITGPVVQQVVAAGSDSLDFEASPPQPAGLVNELFNGGLYTDYGLSLQVDPTSTGLVGGLIDSADEPGEGILASVIGSTAPGETPLLSAAHINVPHLLGDIGLHGLGL